MGELEYICEQNNPIKSNNAKFIWLDNKYLLALFEISISKQLYHTKCELPQVTKM